MDLMEQSRGEIDEMVRDKITLITGANGEVGHGLIDYLYEQPDDRGIVVLDIRGLDSEIADKVDRVIVGDILDTHLLDSLMNEYEIDTIFHLAALLSTHSEFQPEAAHRVNVQGTINLLRLAIDEGASIGRPVKFIYPSSIAAYGVPDLATKAALDPVHEDDYLNPTTMYGCNKLYCEHLGRYYALHYQQLSQSRLPGVDFRCVRFPGLISATTTPAGGTSDYGPEMLHAAAKDEPYAAFVREDTAIPFMTMPDAITAILHLANAPRENLSRFVYNVTGFSLTAGEFADIVRRHFPDAQITFEPDVARQGIVDTWPRDVNDDTARHDLDWQPAYDLERAFSEYLMPAIKARYGERV